MSFDNLPASLIKRILGSIPDLRQRCRLERVSKTFQSCLQDHSGAAWTTDESKLVLGCLLYYNPDFVAKLGRVSSISIRTGFSGHPAYFSALSALYRNIDVFHQLNELRISEPLSIELWNWLLSTFHKSLNKVFLKARTPFLSDQIDIVFKLLAYCGNLRQFTIQHAKTVDANNLYDALKGKKLEKLALADCTQITEAELAFVINSFPAPRSFRELVVRRGNQDPPDLFLTFSLDHFCQNLHAAAVEKMSKMCLDGVYGAFLATLPILPVSFPILTECKLKVYAPQLQAIEVVRSLSQFLSAGQEREKPIHLHLVIFTEANDPLLTNIWDTLHLLKFNKSLCIKRMHEETRKVTYGRASVMLTLKGLEDNGKGEETGEEDEQMQQDEGVDGHQEQQEQVLENEEEGEQLEEEEEGEDEEEDQSEDGEEEMDEEGYDADEEAEGNNYGDDGNFEEEVEEDEVHEAGNPHQNAVFMPNIYFYPYGVVQDEEQD